MRKSVARVIHSASDFYSHAHLSVRFLSRIVQVYLLCFSLHCCITIDTIMDCRSTILLSFVALLAILVMITEGRNKKVVIHVPYKVKKIRHTHTVYKTIHHHHTHHEPHVDHEEHEHFHHLHIHDEPPSGQHSQPVPGIGIPEFLPDLPDSALNIPDVLPHEYPTLPGRHIAHVPLYRRKLE